MNISTIKNELQNILSGKSEVSHGESIQAITRYLRESLGTSEKTKKNESSKSEETKKLIGYINVHHLWHPANHPFSLSPKTVHASLPSRLFLMPL